MKMVEKKRLIMYCPWTDEVIIGAQEFDASLSDENILGLLHEVGKTEWLPTYPGTHELWHLGENHMPDYKIEVEIFYVEVPTWFDRIKDIFRR